MIRNTRKTFHAAMQQLGWAKVVVAFFRLAAISCPTQRGKFDEAHGAPQTL
jgi:hypothetical protein